jgi:starch synthase
VVANSQWSARSVVDDYGIDPARVEVLPMGVPLPPPPGPGRSDTGALPRVLFIGRTLGRKGGHDLLAVHQRWLADRCELVLVTQDPVPPGRNLRVVDDVRPGDGRIDQLLSTSALMVLPSRIDQWPNAVMEAMSHGVPAVVSGVGGMPEMVLHGEAGVVLADWAPETLRDAIAGLLDDPDRQRRLGARARRRVEEDLDVQHTANRLLDIVRSAAGWPGAVHPRGGGCSRRLADRRQPRSSLLVTHDTRRTCVVPVRSAPDAVTLGTAGPVLRWTPGPLAREAAMRSGSGGREVMGVTNEVNVSRQ